MTAEKAEVTVAAPESRETVLKLWSDIGQFTGALKRMHETKPDDPKAKNNYDLLCKLRDGRPMETAVNEAERNTLNSGMRSGRS